MEAACGIPRRTPIEMVHLHSVVRLVDPHHPALTTHVVVPHVAPLQLRLLLHHLLHALCLRKNSSPPKLSQGGVETLKLLCRALVLVEGTHRDVEVAVEACQQRCREVCRQPCGIDDLLCRWW